MTLTRIHLRRIAWPAFLLVAAYFSAGFLYAAYVKYHEGDPGSFGLFAGRHGWLFAHLAGGAVTIVLGPLQLLRQQSSAVRPIHRWTGWLYLAGMLTASVAAAGLIATSPAPGAIRLAFAATMLAWLVTAAFAMGAIRDGRALAHRHWMVRNYLVTLAPVTFRLLLPLAVAIGLMPSPELIAALLWVSWMLPLAALAVLDGRSDAYVPIPGMP